MRSSYKPRRITLRGRTVGSCIRIGGLRRVEYDEDAARIAPPANRERLEEWKARADAWAKEVKP